jgi:RimJ/RimL family protein N-acetyltransferase
LVVQNPFLIGTGVYLRPLEREDAQTAAPWFNDAEVNRYLLRYRPLSVAEEEAFLQRLSQNNKEDIVLGIATREGDRLVGACGLNRLDARCRHACLGITIGDKTAWGKGFGREALTLLLDYGFQTLNLNRIWLEVFEYNHRAKRLYEKLGFKAEGRQRQHTYREGRFWDTFLLGILREEWEAAAPAQTSEV